ncbi:protein FAR1-RELATED SEQUENCE 7-like [Juglans microcarpa x Juglans regia]|uniref:protein FAR1-RELATED SEQUENCE 7-like n=1 Tax=Juglans microcarpa x Juglans regia TaxID=2249226 RepID=UPI001B7F4316|nr:protein FAR1-RELATED SEQUENCE 7-like [Juglans microcarpa x Juglans regia]XP_040992381.1 protein FAR1-RELATED SEQUENCE 7-like [Juglans microcarpa x Juglans regia]XP_040992382.1 protein FAR1-RELATED SEQUENCE 7-like [Juglans microcarpa x Juglans regia]
MEKTFHNMDSGINWTPEIGMEFNTLEEAWKHWVNYGKQMGFGVRKHFANKSKLDGEITSRGFVCSKEGVRQIDKRNVRTHREETRTKCPVRLCINIDRETGKYGVYDFVCGHNHILHLPETTYKMQSKQKLSSVQAFPRNLAYASRIWPKETHELGDTSQNMDTRIDWIPKMGMDFDTLEEAWKHWEKYGKQMGFNVRKHFANKSKIDGEITSRGFVCSKEGVRQTDKRNYQTHREETRTNCPVRLSVNLDRETRKYKVYDFVLEHNHILRPPENMRQLDRNMSGVQDFTIDLTLTSGIKPKAAPELMCREVDGRANLGYIDLNHRIVNLGMGVGSVGSSDEGDLVVCGKGPAVEPYVGMEFESEEAAKEFYDDYARCIGFIMRVDECRRSGVDKRIISRRFSCNKQGFYVKARDESRRIQKPQPSKGEGCKAMMSVEVHKSGKWIVTSIVKDHGHPLVFSGHPSRGSLDSRERRIQELTMELQRQDRLCELYRELLLSFLENVEEQTELLSRKVEIVVNDVRELESRDRSPKAFTK